MACTAGVMDEDIVIACSIVMFVISLVAIIGNLLIMWAVIKDPLEKLHKPFNFLLVNLALSDFIAGCLVVFYVSQMIHHYKADMIRLLDNTTHYLCYISLYSVLLSTVALSIDRLLAITKPLKYRQNLGWKRSIITSMTIWTVSIVLGIFVSTPTYGKVGDTLVKVFLLASYLGGVLAMGIIYYRVNTFLRFHEEEFRSMMSLTASESAITERCSTEKKINKTFLAFFLVLTFTYVPALTFQIVLWYYKKLDCQLIFYISMINYMLLTSNSACNLFICTIRLKDFKESLFALFKKRTTTEE